MRAFRRERGMFVAELDADERAAVAAVVADVAQLLGAGRLEDGRTTGGPGDDDTRQTAPPTEHLAGLSLRIDDIAAPDDAAVRRLLPDASRNEPSVSAEFRRLTEDDLRRVKTARLTALWDALTTGPADGWPRGALVVHPDAGADLAATITDLRLVLADRLGLDDDEASEALYADLERELPDDDDGQPDPPADVRRYLGSIYAALSWLQESLLDVLLDELDRPR
ncbi:DUF2017 domain-containing protein [Cellulomonas sp. WB94]|uniref:DUF2017 family protein n=1 Tax=Cellulomonas sp. WB94 TaxID=2173174 RepID=UPI000D569572|nr:DUF2017 family protein [Cellulomonas sp. WB94]PVU83932.1 DUF2017 domain-containing protein [Cellulomonas sp. WB94]